MHLENYISDLLYRYDCVTIPEFGAFLTHRVSAKVHESTHAFYPPKKVVSFNEQLQHNDGLLASYITEVEKIPYEAALVKINKHVKSIKSFLILIKSSFTLRRLFNLFFRVVLVVFFAFLFGINCFRNAFDLLHFALVLFVLLPQLVQLHLLVRS